MLIINTPKKFIIIQLLTLSAVVYSKQIQSDTYTNGITSFTTALIKSKESKPLPAFDETSLTRKFLNKYIGLKWKNSLGDWIDINGVAQGNTAWSSANVTRSTTGPIKIDVTRLAKEQQGKKNQLMVFSATVPVKISSKEGDHGPILKIIKKDGGLINLDPTLDCAISLSTHKNINTTELSFNKAGEKAFIQFPLPPQEIRIATLELWPIKIFGSGQIQIFNLNFKSGTSTTIKGIASTKSSYAELISHPDIIFVDTFEDTSIKKEWADWTGGKSYSSEHIKNGYFAGVIDPKDKNHSAVNLRYFFSKNINEEPTEIYFRYSVRFHKDVISDILT